jgi:predicted dehydrogenase
VDQSIRWGIWGTGAIANKVASDIPLAKGAILHAVASRTEERARQFALRHRAAKWYGSLGAMLADADVDAVYVSTPNHRHAGDSIACIEAGKAVLCEKPFALNLAQAQQTVDAARRSKVFCMEAMWTRFIPAVIEAKRLIDSGAIGPVRLIQGNFGFIAPEGSKPRLFDLAMGGGALMDIGIYPISFAHHLLGAPQSVTGTTRLGPTGVDLHSAYQLLYPNGALADLWSSFQVQGTNEAFVFGERGMLHLCTPFYHAHRLILQTHTVAHSKGNGHPKSAGASLLGIAEAMGMAPAVKSMRRRLSPLLALLKRGRVQSFPFAGNGYQFELMEVNRCLREKRIESAVMPLDETLEVMRTLDALRSQWGMVFPQE